MAYGRLKNFFETREFQNIHHKYKILSQANNKKNTIKQYNADDNPEIAERLSIHKNIDTMYREINEVDPVFSAQVLEKIFHRVDAAIPEGQTIEVSLTPKELLPIYNIFIKTVKNRITQLNHFVRMRDKVNELKSGSGKDQEFANEFNNELKATAQSLVDDPFANPDSNEQLTEELFPLLDKISSEFKIWCNAARITPDDGHAPMPTIKGEDAYKELKIIYQPSIFKKGESKRTSAPDAAPASSSLWKKAGYVLGGLIGLGLIALIAAYNPPAGVLGWKIFYVISGIGSTILGGLAGGAAAEAIKNSCSPDDPSDTSSVSRQQAGRSSVGIARGLQADPATMGHAAEESKSAAPVDAAAGPHSRTGVASTSSVPSAAAASSCPEGSMSSRSGDPRLSVGGKVPLMGAHAKSLADAAEKLRIEQEAAKKSSWWPWQ